jgi:hypothetical protein
MCGQSERGQRPGSRSCKPIIGALMAVAALRLAIVHTFIRAFESSPVHWVKFRPCLNRRRPGNGGASAILGQSGEAQCDW